MSAPPERIETGVAVAGGGPAGVMTGLLLARAGIETVVLEKHADFLRDFRGDTIHPSSLTVLDELGLLESFLERPHQKVARVSPRIGGRDWPVGEFSRLRRHPPYIALIPQWEFLDFLVDAARRWPGFHVRMRTEAEGLIEEDGAVAGVRAQGPDGPVEIRARLTVAADGRHSRLRAASGLPLQDLGAPIDVLWMRVPRRADHPDQPLAIVGGGRFLVLIWRDTYWQCAYVIPKGGFEALKARGLPAFHAGLRQTAPFLGDCVEAVASWNDVKLLTVRVDRLRRWHRPGLLVIGDAAHAMSPVGGVGINLAIQDAVATANLLAGPLARGRPDEAALASVQKRRDWPARMIQRAQVLAHERVIAPVLAGTGTPSAPWPLRLLAAIPPLRALPALAIGVGLRPEHVRSPDAISDKRSR